jgi:PAS domain S-box-containing protein
MLKGERILPYEIFLISKDGQERVATLHTEAMKDEKGEIIGALAVIFDVTEQKKYEETLRRERDRTQMYFETSGILFLALNRDKTVALINQKGCEVLGYGKEEIMGKNWMENFLPARYREETEAIWKSLMQGEIGPFERVKGAVVTKSGAERLILWNNAILKDENGSAIGTLSSGEDITEKERAEQELRKTLTALREFKDLTVGREDRMIDLKKEINKLSEELGRPKPYDISFSEE